MLPCGILSDKQCSGGSANFKLLASLLWAEHAQCTVYSTVHIQLLACPIPALLLCPSQKSGWQILGNKKSYERPPGVKMIKILRLFRIGEKKVDFRFLDLYWIFDLIFVKRDFLISWFSNDRIFQCFLVTCVGHMAWALDGRKGRSQEAQRCTQYTQPYNVGPVTS